ncbi:hypothetical protein [Enterobacter hormaechei]|uniref:hypothetical protein n=1 Tax=Enterobacter hormaechei TaxID=158836 RepID=UPI002FF1D9F3
MAELTKEWLQQTIAELEEERDAVPGVVNEDAARALAAMKRALASLEAEAIGFAFADDLDLMRKKKKIGGMLTVRHHGEIAVYTAPPVPVSVSGEVTGAIENLKQTLVDCNRYNYCSGAVKRLENACRAAMLQGADGNSPVIPDDVRRMDWLVSKTVDVREPMVYGSHSLFWSQTITDEEDDYHATKLREQIDAAMAAEQAAEPQQEAE